MIELTFIAIAASVASGYLAGRWIRTTPEQRLLVGRLIRTEDEVATWKRISRKSQREADELTAVVETLKLQLAPTGD